MTIPMDTISFMLVLSKVQADYTLRTAQSLLGVDAESLVKELHRQNENAEKVHKNILIDAFGLWLQMKRNVMNGYGWIQLPHLEELHMALATTLTDAEIETLTDIDLSSQPFLSTVYLQKRQSTLAFPQSPLLIPVAGHQ